VVQLLLASLQNPLEIVETERRIQVGEREFPAALKATAVMDMNREIIGAVLTFSDLTALKQMEEEVQQSRILSALGEMAATVAHEIRNPLGGIGGYAGLLARGLEQDDPKRRLVEKIIQGVSSLNKIVSNLLYYTRKTVLRSVRLDLVEYLDEQLGAVEIEVEKDNLPIVIERKFPDGPVEAEIDPEKFSQVMLNLCFNGVHAMEAGGTLTVELAKQDGSPCIRVRDTGCGIPTENLEQIFTPFFTTKEQGTGLGLAIVRKIVDLHGGSIGVRSTVGQGTEFSITLRG
jgi:signal transduction histidine kinase